MVLNADQVMNTLLAEQDANRAAEHAAVDAKFNALREETVSNKSQLVASKMQEALDTARNAVAEAEAAHQAAMVVLSAQEAEVAALAPVAEPVQG
jgi:precorrin-3B methylase